MSEENYKREINKVIEIKELPKYSDWIEFLIGLKKTSKKKKNLSTIEKEFGKDKWLKIRKAIKNIKGKKLEKAIESEMGRKKKNAYWKEDNLYLADSSEINKNYFEIIRITLEEYIEESNCLIELGAGYGSIILRLAKSDKFKNKEFIAGEYTEEGQNCLKIIAKEIDCRIQIGYCDLTKLDLKSFNVPPDSIIITNWALAYQKGISRKTIEEIIKIKPKLIINFEPIYENWNEKNLLHYFWRRYAEINDYNKKILEALLTYQKEGIVKIINNRKNVIGDQPLAPISIITWKPCRDIKDV